MPYPVRFNCSIALPCAAAAAACNNGLSIRRSRSSTVLNVLRINSISRPYRLLYKCSFGGGSGGCCCCNADDDDDEPAFDDGDINGLGWRADATSINALRVATAAAVPMRWSSSMA